MGPQKTIGGAARHAVGMAGCRQPLALMGPTVCSALFVLP